VTKRLVFSGGSFRELYDLSAVWNVFENFGRTGAAVGDTDGDAVPDFAVGGPGIGASFCNPGYVVVYSGATGSPRYMLVGTTDADLFGDAIAGAIDVNADALADVAVGAYKCCAGCGLTDNSNGRVHVFDGATGIKIVEMADPGVPRGGSFGFRLMGLDDVDGDGLDDLAATAFSFAPIGEVVRILSPGQGWQPIYSILTPVDPNDYTFGQDLESAGDVDSDGFPDFYVGCPFTWFAPYSSGFVLLYSGAPAGVTTYGSACAAANGRVPRIAVTGVPAIGTTVAVTLSEVGAGLPAIFFLGVSNTNWLGIPLPFPLTSVGMPGCFLATSVEILLPTATAPVGSIGGSAAVALPIPNNASLVGLSLYAQWLVLNPLGSSSLGATTKGLELTFQ
jgi:hypothetical protein